MWVNVYLKSGIKRGDIIVQVNGKNVHKNADLLKVLKETPNLNLTVNRNNSEIQVELKAEQKDWFDV